MRANRLVVPALLSLLTLAAAPTATAPAEQPLDGLRAYNTAMYADDEKTMLSRMHAPNDDVKKLAKAAVQTDLRVAQLVKVSIAKFGKNAEAKVSKAIGDIREVDVKDIKINGDKAELLGLEGARLSTLILIDGKWKLFFDTSDGEVTPRQRLDGFLQAGNFAKVLKQDVEAGKYATLEDLVKAIESANER